MGCSNCSYPIVCVDKRLYCPAIGIYLDKQTSHCKWHSERRQNENLDLLRLPDT